MYVYVMLFIYVFCHFATCQTLDTHTCSCFNPLCCRVAIHVWAAFIRNISVPTPPLVTAQKKPPSVRMVQQIVTKALRVYEVHTMYTISVIFPVVRIRGSKTTRTNQYQIPIIPNPNPPIHQFAGNSPKKLFSCQLCGKLLCSKASLKRHIADKHAVRQEEYRCAICERVYCSRNSLMTHIYTYHKSRPGEMEMKDIKLYNQFNSSI